MIRKDTKKGITVYHKQFGKAVFMGWFDHEAKEYAIIEIAGAHGRITLPRKELSDTPRKISGIKPGWYSCDKYPKSHFWIPMDITGGYRSVCGKIEFVGEALIAETHPRCKRCEISARGAVKTTLFDFKKG
ncbi:MAG: hypothetical protein Q8J68_08040 [Methanolobus sp.]|uniref:hypothetical protein n=1 Tax=Methanolobus sp. TaxID=1874737 RepID=UPI00272F3BBA|nr:hypothetical protein [Methanolobus sp.]MDP2217219.1 hypothetical protein [Methanolobus sp.]